jgi:hypothetical protein
MSTKKTTETKAKAEPVKRKRPGRPKKNVPQDAIPKEGIVDKPTHMAEDQRMETTMEVVYSNPELWKKIFNMFKNLSVESVRMNFHETGISMISKDHLEKSEVLVEIVGERLNRYYCETPTEIGVDQHHILQILQTLKKDHSKITFLSTRETRRSKLRIMLHNAAVDADNGYNIDVTQVQTYQGTIHEDLELEPEYPISFELDAKFFKNSVADWARLGEVIKIEKESDEKSPLMISHVFEDKKGDHDTIFKDPKKINLKTDIPEGDLFAVSILLQHLKPISTSTVSDKIKVAAHENHRLIFTSLLDQKIDEDTNKPIEGTEVCTIKILTEIVNFDESDEEEEEE